MSSLHLTSTNIDEGWTLTHTAGEAPPEIAGRTVKASVPGTTHTDLLSAGLIPEPYYGRNETDLAWMWRCDWRYSTTFDAAKAAPGERVDLVFDGLDTVATVTLNSEVLARTANMHRTYRLDARAVLAGGTNELSVDFASALNYAFEREAILGDRPRPQPNMQLWADAARAGLVEGDPDEIAARKRVYPQPYNAIRKMACSFGWDWGPDLQTAGIWKPVRIERWSVARLASVRPLVGVDGTTGLATVHVEVQRDDEIAPENERDLTVTASVGGVSASATIPAGSTTVTIELAVPSAKLWWPAGYGEPTLHELTVTLAAGDDALDTFAKRIGFRSVSIDRGDENRGNRFAIVINGKDVVIRGANWIPDDHFLTRITRERLERRVDQALGAHMNLLRIWGGGIFETDDFYDVCDERGVLVWQDFLFACAAYSEDAETIAEVEAEVRDNVTRLSTHASLVVYNGSNENVWGWFDWGWQDALQGMTWGQKYYEEILPTLLAELDPSRPYVPSSPFSTFPFDETVHPNDPTIGTVHEWNVWNRNDYTAYREYAPLFCSEFGFQGPATWATMKTWLPDEAFDQDNEIWLMHQKADDGNGKLKRGFAPHLPGSDDFETWHWITSLNQARAIRYGIEHYRSWMPHTMGTIVWQLNDCWPVTSWAAIDSDERLKPLYFALRAAYEPRLLTFQPRAEDGSLDQNGPLHLIAVNDTDTDWNETLTFTRAALDGTEVAVATAHLLVPARASATLAVPAHVASASDASGEIIVADAGYPGDDDHVRAIHTPSEDKDMAYTGAPYDAVATATGGGFTVKVTAKEFVRDLTVLADKVADDAVVDTSLVSLLAGESHTFVITGASGASPDAFVSPRVLVSVNSIVAGAA